MAKIYHFPNADEREWLDLEAMFLDAYKDVPYGTETMRECLPEIKRVWTEMFVPFSVQPEFRIPGPVTPEQERAINNAVELGASLVAERLKKERSRAFGMMAGYIYNVADSRRNL